MASPDRQIIAAGVASTPLDYTVPNAQELIPLAVTASFDGSGAGGSFVPTLQIISDAGVVVATCPQVTTVAAGASADATWFPRVKTPAQAATPSPNPLGTLWAWFDFSDATTYTLDGSGRLAGIADKTGNGHNLTQSVAAQRPGFAVVNGLAAGLFAHASQQNLTWGQSGSTSEWLQQPYSIALVFTQDLAPGGGQFPGPIGGHGTPPNPNIFMNETNNLLVIEQGIGSITRAFSAPFTQQQVTGIYDGAASSFRLNTFPVAGTVDVDPVSMIGLGGAQIPSLPGQDDALQGKICEVLYYSGHLSAAQLSAVESYLKTKWGTP